MRKGPNGEILNNAGEDVNSPDYKGTFWNAGKKTGFTELEDKYWRALNLIRNHLDEPDVIKSIVDKAIGRPEDVIPIEEPEDENDVSVNAPSAEALAKGAFGDEHFGEEQAEGLDNLLEGLKDTPHDDRW